MDLSTIANRDAAIVRLQSTLADMHNLDPTPDHFFAAGMYGRKLALPAGSVVVGKRHRHEHLLACLRGRAMIADGRGLTEVTAGHVSVSPAGAKRAVHALEDTVFLTIHLNPTDTQDVAEIEAAAIEWEPGPTALPAPGTQLGLPL